MLGRLGADLHVVGALGELGEVLVDLAAVVAAQGGVEQLLPAWLVGAWGGPADQRGDAEAGRSAGSAGARAWGGLRGGSRVGGCVTLPGCHLMVGTMAYGAG